MEPCKVQLSQVASIVHVSYKNIDILSSAKGRNRALLSHLNLLLEKVSIAERKYTSEEIIHIPNYVQEQKRHDPEHFESCELKQFKILLFFFSLSDNKVKGVIKKIQIIGPNV